MFPQVDNTFSRWPLLPPPPHSTVQVTLGGPPEEWTWRGSLKNDQPTSGQVCYYDTYSDWVPLNQVLNHKGKRKRRHKGKKLKQKILRRKRESRRNEIKMCLLSSLPRRRKQLKMKIKRRVQKKKKITLAQKWINKCKRNRKGKKRYGKRKSDLHTQKRRRRRFLRV